MIFHSFRGHREFPTRPSECPARCERRSADGLDQQTFIRTSAAPGPSFASDMCLTSLQKNIRELDFGGAEKSIIYLTRCTHFLNLLGKFCLKQRQQKNFFPRDRADDVNLAVKIKLYKMTSVPISEINSSTRINMFRIRDDNDIDAMYSADRKNISHVYRAYFHDTRNIAVRHG